MNSRIFTKSFLRTFLKTLIIGVFGGAVFKLLHLPLPWTLGSLAFIAVARLQFKQETVWPLEIRDTAMLVLGYVMGRTFTPETGQRILSYFPLLIGVTLFSLVLCLVGGFLMHRFTGISLATALFGSMPAGLTQSAAICEEIEGADIGVIALIQTVRVLIVVFFVPFFALHGLADQSAPVAAVQGISWPEFQVLAFFLTVIFGLVAFGKRIKFPARFVFFPILGTAALTLAGLSGPALPSWVIAIAQVCVGIRIGMSVNITSLAGWKKISLYSLFNVVGLLSGLMLADYLVTQVTPISFLTIFIGTAPGGMAEMGLTAMMVQADLPTVIAFQLFRLMFVLLITMPVMSWLFRRKKVDLIRR